MVIWTRKYVEAEAGFIFLFPHPVKDGGAYYVLPVRNRVLHLDRTHSPFVSVPKKKLKDIL